MGRATRWLKNIFGINPNSSGDRNERMPSCYGGFGRSARETGGGLCQNPNTIPPNITPAEAAWLKSFYSESDKEQNKHAIAVAAATAAAADAAVAAAHAAVAVVRLTSQGRSGTMFGSRERWAAIKIQSVFRGYLARKAHRALKGLVKLQALVRGYLIRKQATATLHSMQALIRAQASVRAQRTRRALLNSSELSQPQLFPPRKSVERFDEASHHNNKSFNSSRLSASFDSTNTSAIEESTKIVEIDTGRPKSRSRRTNTDSGDEASFQTQSSPRLYRPPPRLSIPDNRNSSQESEWGLAGEECRGFSTAQSTPRFASSCNGTGGPVTPAMSVSIESLFRSFGNSPNYMANTQSFKAKLRSHSAPKQRPDPGSKKKLAIDQVMESRNSLSGVKMQRSCSHVQEVLSFKNAVIGKLGRPTEFVRQQHFIRETDY